MRNDRAWFAANAEIYRTEVDRPWRRLIGAVAETVHQRLPEVDTAVKTGRVLSRIQLQWPRPGAAYRTGLRATFAAPDQGRRPDCCLFVTLDASGLRAGAEVLAGSDAWRCVQQRLEGRASIGAPDDMRWVVAGEPGPGGEAPELAERMAAVRQGSLRLAAAWTPEEAAAAGPALAAGVIRSLGTAALLYEWGTGTPAVPDTPAPSQPAIQDRERGAGSAVPVLPRALHAALARRAQQEGVTVDAFILYLLTKAAMGRHGLPAPEW